MVAGTTADAASSWGKIEGNPLLGRNVKFGAGSLAIKLGLTAGFLVPQLACRHRLSRRTLTIVNFGEAGLWAGAAGHNWRVK